MDKPAQNPTRQTARVPFWSLTNLALSSFLFTFFMFVAFYWNPPLVVAAAVALAPGCWCAGSMQAVRKRSQGVARELRSFAVLFACFALGMLVFNVLR